MKKALMYVFAACMIAFVALALVLMALGDPFSAMIFIACSMVCGLKTLLAYEEFVELPRPVVHYTVRR